MLTQLLAFLSFFILSTIERLGYGGVFVLMTLESAGLPIPSEIIMPFSGFLVSQGSFSFWLVVALGTAGNVVGSLLFYWLGVYGGRAFVLRYGKYIFFHASELERAERWFSRWGNWAIFFSRLLPAVRTYISFPAGLTRMKILPFTLLTLAGSLPWVWALAYIGVVLGERWEIVEGYFRRFDEIIVGVGVLGVGWLVWRHYKLKSKIR